MNDLISRDVILKWSSASTKITNPDKYKRQKSFIDCMNDKDIMAFGDWMFANGFNTALEKLDVWVKTIPSTTIVENTDGQPEWEKAKWIRKENAVAIYYNCSSCRGALNWRGRFCPYCGAEMENRAG